MACCLVAGDFALPEQLHHLGMFSTFGFFQEMAILLKEVGRCIEGCALVSIDKGMVAGNAFGIASRKLKPVRLAIGVLVLRSGQSGLKQGRVPQPLCTASHINHGFMDELDLLTRDPLGICHLLANSMMVLR